MVSATVPGLLKFFMETRGGHRELVYQGQVAALAAGGCSEGVPAAKPSDWLSVPVSRKATRGGTLVIEFTPTAGVTLDASDAVWNIPVVINGVVTPLANNSTDFGKVTLGDLVLPAGIPAIVAQKEFAPFEIWQMGGGKIFVAIENNG